MFSFFLFFFSFFFPSFLRFRLKTTEGTSRKEVTVLNYQRATKESQTSVCEMYIIYKLKVEEAKVLEVLTMAD